MKTAEQIVRDKYAQNHNNEAYGELDINEIIECMEEFAAQEVQAYKERLKEGAPDQLTLRCRQLSELNSTIPPVQGLEA